MGEMVRKARTVTLYVALMALVAATFAIIGANDAGAFPGGNGLIAYDDGANIMTMNPDGSNPQILETQGRGPSWSGDGTKLAYTDTSSSDFFIHTINADGSGETQITTGGDDFDPAFSPDGSWIAFRREVRYPNTLESAAGAGSSGMVIAGLVGLTPNTHNGYFITNTTDGVTGEVVSNDATTITTDIAGWDPADTFVIFNTQDRIFKIMANGSGEIQLSNAGASDLYSDYSPAWSPDGASIAFATKRNGNDDIYVMDAAGEGVSSVNLTGTELNVVWDPAWSPDGSKIVYSSANNGAGGDSAQNIWVMDANGDNKTILVASGNGALDEHPTWSPDGTTIAFERLSAAQLTVVSVPAAGGSVTTLEGPVAQSPEWQAGVVGVNDSGYDVDEGGTLNVNAAGGVLANDLFPVSTPGSKSATKVTDPSNGTVTLNADGSFTYIHNDSDTLSDTFTYQPVQDGVVGTTATVSITINPVVDPPPPPEHKVTLIDPSQGLWYLYDNTGALEDSFFFGNPGDYPFMGDWNCDGVETPGMYRQSDGYVYLRLTNDEGPGDIRFFFGNPGDVPIAGDFNNDGCDTVSIYRPSNQTFYIINELGENDGGLGEAEFDYVFGNPGDKPFVGDFDGDGVETVGLHRESTGLVYFRNSHTQGNADEQFIFGDPGDRLVAGDWNKDGSFSPALFRPSNTTMYFRYTNTQGVADNEFVPAGAQGSWLPVSGTR